MDLWKLGDFPSSSSHTQGWSTSSDFFIHHSFLKVPHRTPNREMTKKKKKDELRHLEHHATLSWLILPLLWHTAYFEFTIQCHLYFIWWELHFIAIFFYLLSFFVAVGFLLIKGCCLSPLSVWVRLLDPPSLNAFWTMSVSSRLRVASYWLCPGMC